MRIAIVKNIRNIYFRVPNSTLRTGNSDLILGYDTILAVNNKILVSKKNNEIYFDGSIKFENFCDSLLNKLRFSFPLPYIVIFEDADMVIIEQRIDILKIFGKFFPKKSYSSSASTLYTWEIKCYAELLNIPVNEIRTDYNKKLESIDLAEKYSDLEVINFSNNKTIELPAPKNNEQISFLDLYDVNVKSRKGKLVIYDIWSHTTVPTFIKEIYLLGGVIYLKIDQKLSEEHEQILVEFVSELFDSLIDFDIEVEGYENDLLSKL